MTKHNSCACCFAFLKRNLSSCVPDVWVTVEGGQEEREEKCPPLAACAVETRAQRKLRQDREMSTMEKRLLVFLLCLVLLASCTGRRSEVALLLQKEGKEGDHLYLGFARIPLLLHDSVGTIRLEEVEGNLFKQDLHLAQFLLFMPIFHFAICQ